MRSHHVALAVLIPWWFGTPALSGCHATGGGTNAPPTILIAPVVGDEPEVVPPSERSVELAVYCGAWRETWGVNEETDVTYHDIYLVDVHRSELTFTSPQNPEYEFRRVEVHGARLEVELVNQSGSEEFLIVYDAILTRDRDAIHGTATTPERVFTIRWDRMSYEELELELGGGALEALDCVR